MASTRHICMIAAENDVIPGAKVGGIGDVVRDIPRALADEHTRVTVIIPAYGAFHERADAQAVNAYSTRYRGVAQRIELFEVAKNRDANVQYLVMHHPLFASGGKGQVYCDDDAHQPFATDANKFALFSVASLDAIVSGVIEPVDVLHLHDWHAALALPLIRFDNTFESLRGVRTVFSIHNLALQGIRPFAEHTSSLQAWFPHLHYDPALLADPRWPHCVNPVAAAIRLADKVHTVSPTYALEIVRPDNPAAGFHGGEGLENDLATAAAAGKLVGIINGIEYPAESLTKPSITSPSGTPAAKLAGRSATVLQTPRGEQSDKRLSWREFAEQMGAEMLNAMARGDALRAVDYVTHQRILTETSKPRPKHILTSVGRMTDQKMAILLHPLKNGVTALEQMLGSLSGRGLVILMGSGDVSLELQCKKIAATHSNLLFINQYSVGLSELLFANGDLFLMPSSFEPCGISQMLAMKQAQPCLAHAVGGLRDTITDNVDGFLFEADSLDAQAVALLLRTDQVLEMRETRAAEFDRIASAAHEKRFNWSASASRYKTELYS